MDKRRNKHRSRGTIGKPISVDSVKTTEDEEKRGLKRGHSYTFSQKVTADAFPMNGGSKPSQGDFKSGQFISSTDKEYKFIGQPLNHKLKEGGRVWQFFLHVDQLKDLQFLPSSQ